jgi:hypothetical protein
MAKVTVEVRELRLGPQDIVFVANGLNGKIGELHLSRGSVDWWPRGVKSKAIRLKWQTFGALMEERRSNVRRRTGRRPGRS